MERNFETALVDQCAPTLAGVKPANLFRFAPGDLETTRRSAEEWDGKLKPLGIRVSILKECSVTAASMVYVYREKWVSRILTDEANRAFLEKIGYRPAGDREMLKQLSHRLCLEQEYPHEIGVFLGYPLKDVIGFIENRGWNYTCCGCWKSYSDPEAAQRCFACYRACTALYRRMYAQGVPVVRLAVAA